MGSPTVGKCGDAAESFKTGFGTVPFMLNGLIPEQAVLMIGIDFKGMPEDFLGPGVLLPCEIDLGEVDEHRAFITVLREVIAENLFGFSDLVALHENEGPYAGAACGALVDFIELFGGVGDIGEKAIVDGCAERVVKLVGVVPGFLEAAGEDIGDPVVTRNSAFATIAVEDVDRLARVNG